MKYEKAVEQWNQFCIESGIRDYCQNKCKGYCCEPFYKDCKAKGVQCHNSIACASYLCWVVERNIPKEIKKEYYEHKNAVIKRSLKIGKLCNNRFFFHDIWGADFPNTMYWKDPTELIQSMMTVDWAKVIKSLAYNNKPRY